MKNSLPKVSVVTTAYNQRDYILDTIKGVLMQEYEGIIEFIICDDCSPDATEELVKEYLKTINVPENIDIKYTKHSVNKGAMTNLLWGIKQATGTYIALCDGDDYWIDKIKLKKQIGFLEANPDFSLCHTQVFILQKSGELVKNTIIKQWNKENDVLDYKKAIFIPIASSCTPVFRNNINKKYYRTDIIAGDWMTWVLCTLKGKAKFFNEETAVYRIGIGNSTGVNFNEYLLPRIFFLSHIFFSKITLDQRKWVLKGIKYYSKKYIKYKLSFLKRSKNN